MDGVFFGSPIRSLLEILLAQRGGDLCFPVERRGGAGHDARLASRSVLRRDSTLAVFRVAAKQCISMDAVNHLAFGRRNGDVDSWADRRNLDVFSLEALSIHSRQIQHSLLRAKTVAHGFGTYLRSSDMHVGFQRIAIHGSLFLAERSGPAES